MTNPTLLKNLKMQVLRARTLGPMHAKEMDGLTLSAYAQAKYTDKWCSKLIEAIEGNTPAESFKYVEEEMRQILLTNQLQGQSVNAFSNALEGVEKDIIAKVYKATKGTFLSLHEFPPILT